MALQEGTIAIPLTQGVDIKSDAKTTAGLLDLVNARLDKPGAIRKRAGYEDLGQTAKSASKYPAVSIDSIYEKDGKIVGVGGGYLWEWSADGWLYRGRFEPNKITAEPVPRPAPWSTFGYTGTGGNRTIASDMAVSSGGYVCCAWTEDDGAGGYGRAYICIYGPNGEISCAARDVSPVSLDCGNIKVESVGTRFGVVIGRATGDYSALFFDEDLDVADTISVTVTGTLFWASAPNSWDTNTWSSGGVNYLVLAFQAASTAGTLKLGLFNMANGSVSFATYTATGAVAAIGRQPSLVVTAGNKAVFFYSVSGGNTLFTYWDLSVPATAPTTSALVVGESTQVAAVEYTDGNIWAVRSYALGALTGSDENPRRLKVYKVASLFTVTEYTGAESMFLASKLTVRDNKIYFWSTRHMHYDTSAAAGGGRGTYFLNVVDPQLAALSFLDDYLFSPHGVVFAGLAAPMSFASGYAAWVGSLLNTAGDKYAFCTGAWQGRGSSEYAPYVVTADFAWKPNGERFAGSLALPSGLPVIYDGQGVGWPAYPIAPDVPYVVANGSGGSLSAGTYLIKCVVEWLDGAGRVHQGPPSYFASVVAVNNDSLDLSIYSPVLKPGPLGWVSIYRTTANGSVYYLDTKTGSGGSTGIYEATLTRSDTSLQTQEVLYSESESPDQTPEAVFAVAVRDDRAYMLGQDATVYYSKRLLRDIGTEFAPSTHYVDAPDDAGQAVALAAIDGNTVVLYEGNAVGVFSGDGPGPTGVEQGFSGVRMIQTTAGAKDTPLVATSELGIFYWSDRGISIVTRDGSVQFIGAPVDSIKDATPAAVAVIPGKQEIRFITSDGNTAVYSMVGNAWHWHEIEAAGPAAVVDGEMVYVPAATPTKVLRESDALFTDDGSAYSMTIETGWIKPSGILLGSQRIYEIGVVGELIDNHTMNVQICYDYNNTAAETVTIDTSTLESDAAGYFFRIKPARQECSAIKLKFWDTNQTSTKEAYSMSAIVLHVGIETGLARLPGSKSFGG